MDSRFALLLRQMGLGVTPSGSGHSDEPASSLAADAGSVPNAAPSPNPYGTLREQIAWRIGQARVPLPETIPGLLETRSLSYYDGVGIDHFRHDFNRHEALLLLAADAAIDMLASVEGDEMDAFLQR